MRRNLAKRAATIVGAATLAAGSASCAAGGSPDKPADDGKLKIVSSTSIWGDLAHDVAGDKNAEVVSILKNKSDDPHEYEATARDLAELQDADLVVANGGGYDSWLTDAVRPGTPVVTAVPPAEGHDHGSHDHSDHGEDDHGDDSHGDGGHDHHGHAHGDSNPHVWFDMHIVSHFADNVASELHKLNPSIDDKPTAVDDKTHSLDERIHKLPAASVISTESIAQALVDNSGLKDITPNGFKSAVAKEAEPAAADVEATRKLINDGQAKILITNEQSQTPAAEQLIQAAKDKGISIINVNETPEGDQDYFAYVDAFLKDLEKATGDGSDSH